MPVRSSRTWPSGELEERLRSSAASACTEAAQKIIDADVLLLCTGAGFSADSGLAVYADVAQVDAYARRGLQYHDICSPRWLETEPELFWGFWGQCFNDYRSTAPHEGYSIVNDWADRFRTSAFAESLRTRLAGSKSWPTQEPGVLTPYEVKDLPGSFFAFTSNVDAHHFDWFAAAEIRECHGNIELYQCAAECSGIWRAPLDFSFEVERSSMLAPPSLGRSSENDTSAAGLDLEGAPRIGNVRGGGRPQALRHMPGVEPAAEAVGFTQNHPVCPSCGDAARPAILMFGDWSWQDLDAQEERWNAWRGAVWEEMRQRDDSQPVKAVILEIGAGNNVPTVRHTSEQQLLQWHKAGADVRLVRVNPELPLGDDPRLKSGGALEHLLISIMSGGLASLQSMSKAAQGLLPQDGTRAADHP